MIVFKFYYQQKGECYRLDTSFSASNLSGRWVESIVLNILYLIGIFTVDKRYEDAFN